MNPQSPVCHRGQSVRVRDLRKPELSKPKFDARPAVGFDPLCAIAIGKRSA